MMKKYKIGAYNYELIEDYKEGFSLSDVDVKATEYFDNYDYIVGDWSYGKLRLKGFCDKNNPNYKRINEIESKDKYIKKNCSYDCRYFILKRVKDDVVDGNV